MASVSEKLLQSVSAANWLTEADGAAVEVALRLADELDAATETDDLVLLSKALQGVLASLGLTVSGRVGKASPIGEVNPLDGLRRNATAVNFGR